MFSKSLYKTSLDVQTSFEYRPIALRLARRSIKKMFPDGGLLAIVGKWRGLNDEYMAS